MRAFFALNVVVALLIPMVSTVAVKIDINLFMAVLLLLEAIRITGPMC